MESTACSSYLQTWSVHSNLYCFPEMPKKAELGCCAAWRSLLWDFQSAVWCGRHTPGQLCMLAAQEAPCLLACLPHEAQSLPEGSLLCCMASKVLTACLQYVQQSLSGSDRASCSALSLAQEFGMRWLPIEKFHADRKILCSWRPQGVAA